MPSAQILSAPQAPLRGVFYALALVVFLCAGCEKSPEATPSWDAQKVALETSPPSTSQHVRPSSDSVTFMVYNLRNYLTMSRGKEGQKGPKPELQIAPLLEHIQRVSPDILGVCEIGGQQEVLDLQSRLKQCGLHYPYTEFTTGSDQRRMLAVLSRLPLTLHPPLRLDYTLDGHTHKVSRGILDVQLTLPSGPVRLVGVHLKSKRPSPYWDQELIRRHEAHVVRQHVEASLESGAERLLLYGDFNDTKNSPTIRAIKGTHSPETTLRALDLTAHDGSKWTHYWEHQDIYARIDYAFANASMRRSIIQEESYILSVPHSHLASDHRPLVITFR